MIPGASIASLYMSNDSLPFDDVGDRKLRFALLTSIGALIVGVHIGLAMLPVLWPAESERTLEVASEQVKQGDVRLHLFAVTAAAMAEETERRDTRPSAVQRAEAASAAGSPVATEAVAIDVDPGRHSAPPSGVDEVQRRAPIVSAGSTPAASDPVVVHTEERKSEPSAIGPAGVAVEVPSLAEPVVSGSAVPDPSAAAAVAAGPGEAKPDRAASSRADGQTRAKARPAQQARVKARPRPGAVTQPAGAKASTPVADRIQYRSVFE